MLTKYAGQVTTLWDTVFPDCVRILPEDLSRLDQLLDDHRILRRLEQHWGRANLRVGRPSIAMATYLRLMVLKHSHGWGYERLVYQVSDSFHLRLFCGIAIDAPVPDESTIRKLTRRFGPQLLDDLIREVIKLAVKERGFRIWALRCDSTTQQADICYPTDSGLAAGATKALARAARKLRGLMPELTRTVRDRSRAVNKLMRALTRSLRCRTGEAKEQVQRLTEQIAAQARMAVGQAQKLLEEATTSCRPGGQAAGRAATGAISRLQELVVRSSKIVEQVRQRFAGQKIANRLVSLHDPDARPIRKGKLAQPTEFGYTVQFGELTSSTKKGARGLLLPPKLGVGSVSENILLEGTAAEIKELQLELAEAAFDGGFTLKATAATMAELSGDIFIAGSKKNAGSKRTRRRRASYRVGCEGRIAHLKREYGGRRSRLKGEEGARIWSGWTALVYDVVTASRLQVKEPKS